MKEQSNAQAKPARRAETEKEKRARECAQELHRVLQRYGCTLSPIITIEGERVVSSIRLEAS